MNFKRWVLLISILPIVGVPKIILNHTYAEIVSKKEEKFYYTCPMHPQIHMDHPGNCPICNMKLVKMVEQDKEEVKEKKTEKKVKNNLDYTCPMHPQIHRDHPGECPICHMKLVQNKGQFKEEKPQEGENRSSVYAIPYQTDLIGIQKVEVEKMRLVAKIPVSGRILSQASVALQIYEDDLRYIKPGLTFKGESGVYSEKEITGTITSVDSIADPTSRTIRVVGAIKKGSGKLIPETTFAGQIEIELLDRLAIPASSVLHTGDGDLVYLFEKGGKLIPKKVILGLKTESYFEVLGGLNLGETISSGPNFLIDSEAKIRGVND